MRWIAAWALVMASTSAATATPTVPLPPPPSQVPASNQAPSAPPSPPQTLQARFNAATEAFAAERCAEAVALFAEIEPLVARQRSALASVLARRGICLTRLGRSEEAQAPLQRALALLDPATDGGRVDYAGAHQALGQMAFHQYEYARARSHFRQALLYAGADDRGNLSYWLAAASLFSEQPAAMAAIDEALAALPRATQAQRRLLAHYSTLKARLLLNQGQHGAALALLRQAVAAQGGLDTRVTMSEVETRNDSALAAALSGDRQAVLEYIGYTGAGNIADGPFSRAPVIGLPQCHLNGIEPQDRAVVEFSIGDDGSLIGAQPVWLSNPSDAAAAAFGRAVSSWSWQAADVARIPSVLRSTVRVELRCTLAGERSDFRRVVAAAAGEWLSQAGVSDYDGNAESPAGVAAARAELERRRAAGATSGLIPVSAKLAASPLIDQQEKVTLLSDIVQRMRIAGAPPHARILFEADLLETSHRRVDYAPLANDPEVQADPVAAAFVALANAQNLAARRPGSADMAWLAAAANDSRLAEQHPLRVAALLRLADWQAGSGAIDAARASYAATGLSEQQCSLAGLGPALRSSGVSFPNEALGFSGWAKVEFDVDGTGRTVNRRAVVSYPPLVFAQSAEDGIRASRFTRSFSPSGTQGCSAASQTIVYRTAG